MLEKTEGRSPADHGADKMATTPIHAASESSRQVTTDLGELAGRMDLLEKALFAKLSDLLHPLSEKLDQLTLSIQKVSSVAEGAMDLSVLQQEDI